MPRSGIAKLYGSSIFFFFNEHSYFPPLVAVPVYIPAGSVGRHVFVHVFSSIY